MKAKEEIMPMVTPALEVVDLSKDGYYAATFPHQQLWVVAILWVFALTLPLWTFFSILFMRVSEYQEKFGTADIEKYEGENKEITNLRFLQIKVVKGLKEMFNYQTNADLKDERVCRRQKRHIFLIAFFENLPQSVMQLYETFYLGKTLGSFLIFSTGFSIIMFQKSSALMLPEILWQLKHNFACYQGKFGNHLTNLTIFLVWLFPYAVVSMPFFVFFSADQTD